MEKLPIKLKHSIGFKIGLFLVGISLITGIVSTVLFTNAVRETEFSLFKEENQRMVRVLAKELFTGTTVLKETQIIEGPYGFEAGEIKKIQEKFVQLIQDMTGKNMLLLNIYNINGRVVASTFSEFEGHTADSLHEAVNVNNILAGSEGLAKLVKSEDIHPQLFWKGKEINKDVFEIYVPIEDNGEHVGVVEIYFIPETELNIHIFQMIAVTSISTLVTVVFVYLLLAIYIIRPLRIIRKATGPIGKGEFAGFIKFKHKKYDEIGRLGDDFNKMVRGLNSLSDEIARLKEVGKMKSEFISIVAHQLRTPLTGIKWVLETISEKEGNAEIKKWITKMKDLNERMIKIINDFLDASRIEEGKMSYIFKEKVNLVNLLNNVIRIHKINLEQKHLILSFPQHNSPAVYIKADPDKLTTAFDNLLDNAINYTAKNDTINIGLTKEKDSVIVKITDTGIGIKKEDLPKLFTRFFRSKEARSARPSGSGLGLFIARNIIRDHNSDIRVESQINKGTSFYVKFHINK